MNKAQKNMQQLMRAVALHQAGNLGEASAIYQTILESDRRNIDALRLLGTLHYQQGDHEEAIRLIDLSLKGAPRQPDAYNNRGNALKALERYEEAVASYDKAIALKPEYVEAFDNRGIVLRRLNRMDEAIDAFTNAIRIKPDFVYAYHNMGITLQGLNRYEEAVTYFARAIALKPDLPYLYGDYLHTRMHLADWHNIHNDIHQLTRLIEAGRPASKPFELVALPLPPAHAKRCAEMYVNDKIPENPLPLWKGEKYAHERIRIGYFSGDFHNHATACLMARLFELHDRSAFEITAFSYGPPADDAMRLRLKKSFEHFIDVREKSDGEIAALAREREIDIAIDLKGFTLGARLGIFARRMAPVQVGYLGYPGTSGARYIDYLIADPIIIPESHRPFYSEKIAYLPGSYQVNDSTRTISSRKFTRAELGLPENAFVFCSFNSNYKIIPDIFTIWMRLLQAVPNSVLWLLEGTITASENLRKEAVARGIEASRLIFAPRMELSEHLARHRLADLFLDTYPCNAHTTASDALWAGLPMVTLIGHTFAARVAASLLSAMGVPELICTTPEAYEALALELATNPQKLAACREKLAGNRSTCPLFDTETYARHVEQLYKTLWKRAQDGLPPDHSVVSGVA